MTVPVSIRSIGKVVVSRENNPQTGYSIMGEAAAEAVGKIRAKIYGIPCELRNAVGCPCTKVRTNPRGRFYQPAEWVVN